MTTDGADKGLTEKQHSPYSGLQINSHLVDLAIHPSSRDRQQSRVLDRHKNWEAFVLSLPPIDCWEIEAAGTIETDWLAPCFKRHVSKVGYSRPLSGDYLLPNSAQVVLFRSAVSTRLEIRPKQWESYSGMIAILRRILGDDLLRVARIAREEYNVEVQDRLPNLTRLIKFNRKQTSEARSPIEADPQRVRRSRGRVSEVEYNSVFGSTRSRLIRLYDSSRKHDFPAPMTRVEILNHARDKMYVQNPLDLPSLVGKPIFSDEMKFGELVPLENLTRCQGDKWNFVAEKIKESGLHRAIQEARARYPNFDREKKNIFTWKFCDFDLDHQFAERFKSFIDRAPSDLEVAMISSVALGELFKDKRVSKTPQPNGKAELSRVQLALGQTRAALISSFIRLERLCGEELRLGTGVASLDRSFARARGELVTLFVDCGWDSSALAKPISVDKPAAESTVPNSSK